MNRGPEEYGWMNDTNSIRNTIQPNRNKIWFSNGYIEKGLIYANQGRASFSDTTDVLNIKSTLSAAE